MVGQQNNLLVAWDFWGVINAVDDAQLAGVLQFIMDANGVNIIVSHSSTYEIETFLRDHQLTQYFAKIYGADWHVGDNKLGKTPALKDFISQSGPFSKMVVIGDSLGDVEDGKRAGMKACLFDPKGFYQTTEHGADFVIKEMSEVVDVVVSLSNK